MVKAQILLISLNPSQKSPMRRSHFTETDLKNYYKNHKERYKQQASRTFQYVVFEVEPSESDVENARYWASQIYPEFARTPSNEVPRYVNGTSDEPFDVRYYTSEELPDNIRDSVLNASTDHVIGPYP